VHLNLNNNLWSPESFCTDFGEMIVDLVNCENHCLLTNQKMSNFWLGFENSELRMKDNNEQPMVLKLKDWPTAEDFNIVLPERYDDLMNNLPLGDFTRRDGCFNLVSYLPNCFLKPDLGPKLYIAYSSAHTPKAGTTNLHVDISDAVNVLLYVGVDRVLNKINNKIVKDEIFEILKNTNCDSKQLNRYLNGEKVGAIWHIFLPEDSDKIRSFLKNGKRLLLDHDPIHDQIHYIDNKMLKELKSDFDVEPFVIIQYLGDAIFIPAGAPHQVRNLNSCIKVAEDFVTPHGIEKCFQLTDQFRNLPDTHSNHEDKLQVFSFLRWMLRKIFEFRQ
jgi:lysine-specific demethylase 3